MLQPRYGYRFSMDPIFLAAHVRPEPGDRILDIGAGTGIMPLILGFRYPDVQITAIEIQKELADLAGVNVLRNAMGSRIFILHRDIRTLSRDEITGPVHRIVSNPPYIKLGTGRINPDDQKALSRHELKLGLQDLACSMGRLLDPGGSCHLIYPANRVQELITTLADQGIRTQWIRFVHPMKNRESNRVILSGIRQPGESGAMTVRSPLIVQDENRRLTQEVQNMFRP